MKTKCKNSKAHPKPIPDSLDSGMPIQNRIWDLVKKRKSQFIVSGVVVIFAILSFLDEVLDLPHLLAGAPLTPINWAEIVLDVVALFLVGSISIFMLSIVELRRKRAEEKIKHLNLVLRAIRNVNQLITHEEDRNRLLKGVCNTFIETRGYHNAWIALMDESRRAVTTAEAGLGKAFLPMVERLKRADLTDCGRRVLGQSGVLIIDDPSSTCSDCPLAEKYSGRGAMTVRLEHSGKVYGLLSVSIPPEFTAEKEEQTLFQEIAEDIAFALHSIEQEEGRKRAEEALQISEQKFKDLTETTTDWVWEVDKNGVYTYVSPKVKELLGYEVSEVLGKTPFDLMPKEEAERIGKFFNEKVLNKESFYILENENRHKNGHLVVLETSGIPIFDERGQLEGYRGIDRDITERKRAEEALKKEKDKLQKYLDIAGVMFLVVDLDEKISLINKKGCALLGYDEQEIIGKNVFDTFLPKRIREEVRAVFGKLVAGEIEPVEYYENPWLTKSGEERIFSWHNTIIRDEEGNIIGTLSSAEDITERKRAEEKVKESEEKYRKLVETSNDMIFTVDLKGNFLFSNKAFERTLGYSNEEIKKINGFALVHPDDVESVKKQFAQLVEGKNVDDMEYRYKAKIGSYINILNNASLIFDSQGNVAAAFGIARDITERKRAEEALRESEEKYRDLIENINDFIYTLDFEGNVTSANKSIFEVLGYTSDDLYKLNFNDLIPEKYQSQAIKDFQTVLEQGEIRNSITVLKSKTGKEIWVEANSTAIVKDGKVVGTRGVARDITERKQAEEALRKAHDELEQRVQKRTAELVKANEQLEQEIEERKRAEKALQESELWMRNMFNSLEEGVFVVTPDRTLVNMNQSVQKMFGYSKDELVDLSTEVLHVDHEHYIEFGRRIKEAFGKEKAAGFEFELKRKNGEIFPTEHTVSLLKNDIGESLGIVSVVRDITERKRTEEKLKQYREHLEELVEERTAELRRTNEELEQEITERKRAEEEIEAGRKKLENTFNSMVDGVSVSDENGLIVQANEAVAKMYGCKSVKEMIGKPIFGFIAEKEIPRVRKRYMESINKKEKVIRNLEIVGRRKDGSEFPVMINSTNLWDEKGKFVGNIGVVRDITERKRAEEALQSEKDRLQALMEGLARTGIGIDVVGIDYKILFQNKTLKERFGDLTEKLCYENYMGLKEPCDFCPMMKAIKNNRVESVELKGGGGRNYELISAPFPNPDGTLDKVVEVVMDVTEKKKLEAQLIQAERLSAVGTLSYGIAHEFNNILAGILGNAEFGMGNDDPKEVEKCFRIIMESCDRAKSITNSLLAFSRQREAKKQRADVTDTVETVLHLTERELKKQNIKIVRKFSPIPEITCDLGELSGVLLNMITNARDAMKPNGGTLTIEIGKRQDNIEMIFTDTGCGIPDSIKSRLFEPFVTTKGALGQSEIPGTGLGLFLSYGIISRYHGKIGVKSERGKGSKFTIKIPISKNQESPALVEGEEEKRVAVPQNLNILLVDDEKPICTAIKKFFEAKGHSVTTALSGKKGLNTFKKGSFDLVLADITMPDMDGVELISKLKKIDQQMKFIVLTGHIADDKLESAKKAGADQILMKPFRNEELYQAVGRVLSI